MIGIRVIRLNQQLLTGYSTSLTPKLENWSLVLRPLLGP